MYKAIQIANYIITYDSLISQKGVSNLKVQLVLYLSWIDYYKQTGRSLFSEEFCAFKFGPCVPEVYYKYCHYAGMPIFPGMPGPDPLEVADIAMLNQSLQELMLFPVYSLVDITNKKGGAWDTIFRDGAGVRGVIPAWLIVEKHA